MFVNITFFFFVPFLFCRDHEKTIQFGTFLLWFLFWRLKRLKRTLPTAARHVVPFSTFLSDRKLQSKIFTCCIKASGYQKSTNAKKPEYLTVDLSRKVNLCPNPLAALSHVQQAPSILVHCFQIKPNIHKWPINPKGGWPKVIGDQY